MEFLSFTIKKATDEQRKEYNVRDEYCYILNVEEKYDGIAEWHKQFDAFVVTRIEKGICAFSTFDALLRAIAFDGAKNFCRFVFFNVTDEELRKQMLLSICKIADTDPTSLQRAKDLNLPEDSICIDIIETFSKPCPSEAKKQAEEKKNQAE
ncbi:MAG: hypothetical protein IKM61_08130 [Eubacteriaceae bacterium]|nr:hypothetical protein [Eubacteriaceae bacterium]